MEFEYKRLQTEDGSPTMSLPPTWEPMHALAGAFTETQYIYQPTVEKAFQHVENPAFLSLGLGLAYNELLIAFEALRSGQTPHLVLSYELVPELRTNFAAWIKNESTPLADIYNSIAALYSQKYEISVEDAKNFLAGLDKEGRLKLEGPVEATTDWPACNAILFDAFSSKTSPQLWTADFLPKFFGTAAAETCFLSTYACTGELKRALKNAGFTLAIQKGFGHKRESTFANKIKE